MRTQTFFGALLVVLGTAPSLIHAQSTPSWPLDSSTMHEMRTNITATNPKVVQSWPAPARQSLTSLSALLDSANTLESNRRTLEWRINAMQLPSQLVPLDETQRNTLLSLQSQRAAVYQDASNLSQQISMVSGGLYQMADVCRFNIPDGLLPASGGGASLLSGVLSSSAARVEADTLLSKYALSAATRSRAVGLMETLGKARPTQVGVAMAAVILGAAALGEKQIEQAVDSFGKPDAERRLCLK